MRWLIIGAVVVVLALVFGRKTDESVRVPTDPKEVLARVASSSGASRELKALELAVRAAPGDVPKATAAAKKAIELARREADPRYWGRAEAALQSWWREPRPPDEVLVLRATIRQALHDFDGARVDLEQLDDPQAKLTLATVELVTGRYEASRRACLALEGRVDALVLSVCLAQVDSLTGQAAKARRELEAALTMAGTSHPQRAWGLSVLGEVRERAGDDTAAEAAYREALQVDPEDGYTQNALADLLLEHEREKEVEPLLMARMADDNSLLRLAIAERAKLGKPGAYAQMLRARYAASAERSDTVHLREQARFALEVEGDAAKALELAVKNWAVQKEPADARILRRAATAAGRPELAREALGSP